MRYAMLYNSASGNTRLVAQALEEALAEAGAEVTCAEISRGGAAAALAQAGAAQADAVLVGFWCDKGSCTQDVADALAQLGGKRVFLFGTAGFGGAPEYFDKILSAARQNLPDGATVCGSYMCQGKMPAAVRARYEAMENSPRRQAMLDNFDAALSHPDAADLEHLREMALRR